ncbi:MAG: hypothetical protein E7E73_06505, partial [Negativicoccus succinicivorans]|nr:hypothetical protein [Negativicoccus succinicivorans]
MPILSRDHYPVTIVAGSDVTRSWTLAPTTADCRYAEAMAVSTYGAAQDRYDTMEYRRCGTSGLLLPAISL